MEKQRKSSKSPVKPDRSNPAPFTPISSSTLRRDHKVFIKQIRFEPGLVKVYLTDHTKIEIQSSKMPFLRGVPIEKRKKNYLRLGGIGFGIADYSPVYHISELAALGERKKVK